MGLRFDRPRPEGVRSAHTVVLHVVVMVAVSGGGAGVGSAAADADRLSGRTLRKISGAPTTTSRQDRWDHGSSRSWRDGVNVLSS